MNCDKILNHDNGHNPFIGLPFLKREHCRLRLRFDWTVDAWIHVCGRINVCSFPLPKFKGEQNRFFGKGWNVFLSPSSLEENIQAMGTNSSGVRVVIVVINPDQVVECAG